LTAIVSSVLLVGAFVCYRAGAFDRLAGTGSPSADSESSPTPDQSIFYSSKAGKILSSPGPAPVDQALVDQALMAGSKSYQIIDISKAPTAQPPAGAPPGTTIMSGSKSLFPLSVQGKPQPKAPVKQPAAPSQPAKPAP
jgi:hypothetical protein